MDLPHKQVIQKSSVRFLSSWYEYSEGWRVLTLDGHTTNVIYSAVLTAMNSYSLIRTWHLFNAYDRPRVLSASCSLNVTSDHVDATVIYRNTRIKPKEGYVLLT